MPKVIGYGAAKSVDERRRESFQKQIKELMFRMDTRDKRVINEKAMLGSGRIYKLWHDPGKMKTDELFKISILFDKNGLTFDPRLGIGGASGG